MKFRGLVQKARFMLDDDEGKAWDEVRTDFDVPTVLRRNPRFYELHPDILQGAD